MSFHAQIAKDIELDERFHAIFEQCCRAPSPHTPATPLTPDKIRARVRERAASRLEEASGPTIRRPTRPCKPVTPPARQAGSTVPSTTRRPDESMMPPARLAVLIRALPATAAISRHHRTTGSPTPPMGKTTRTNPRTPVRLNQASANPGPQPSPDPSHPSRQPATPRTLTSRSASSHQPPKSWYPGGRCPLESSGMSAATGPEYATLDPAVGSLN